MEEGPTWKKDLPGRRTYLGEGPTWERDLPGRGPTGKRDLLGGEIMCLEEGYTSTGMHTATGIRTRVSAMRGRRPSPLDDSGA